MLRSNLKSMIFKYHFRYNCDWSCLMPWVDYWTVLNIVEFGGVLADFFTGWDGLGWLKEYFLTDLIQRLLVMRENKGLHIRTNSPYVISSPGCKEDNPLHLLFKKFFGCRAGTTWQYGDSSHSKHFWTVQIIPSLSPLIRPLFLKFEPSKSI